METLKLPSDVDGLQRMLLDVAATKEELEAELAAQQAEIENLREQIRLLLHKRFGPSSEKLSREQLQLFNEAEGLVEKEQGESSEPTVPVSAHTRVKAGRRPLPASLPRVEVIHDIPEEQKMCPHDGHELKRIGEETSEQLSLIPARMQVILHIRPKYACPKCEDGVKIAPLPAQPVPKSMASPSLLAHIAISKYNDALPLYRQSKIFERIGIDLSRTTMASWMIKVGDLIQPVINLLHDELIDGPIIQSDETRCQVLKENGRKPQSQSYLWAQRGGSASRPVILFDYDPSRGGEVPMRLLEGFSGYLQTDGYKGYDPLCQENEKIRRAGCFAHARRKFSEAVKAQMGKKSKSDGSKKLSKAHQGLSYIKRLYEIEGEIRGCSPEERKEARETRAQPILDDMKKWLARSKGQVPPKSLTGRALTYLSEQWERLNRYLEDGRLEIDNNAVENAIRPFVIGRKNWLFSDTVEGANASANIYSLIETAKANRLDPYRYLCHLLTVLPKAKTVEEIESLMPTRCTDAEIAETIRQDPAFW